MTSKSKVDKHSTDIEFGTQIPVRVREILFKNVSDNLCLSNVLRTQLPVMWSYISKITQWFRSLTRSLTNENNSNTKKEQT